MVRVIGWVFLLLVLVAGLSFGVLNAEPVRLNYYFGTRLVPLSLTLVLAFALGVVLGVVASLGIVLKLKREVARLNRLVKLTEKEVMNLRTMPIKDVH